MTPEEQQQMLDELETQLERLQALYNQYFMGIEKLEPTTQRKEVERKLQALRREQIHNTALRFRFQTQVQKFNTQSQYWNRICKQIEEGTYKRDVMRAQKIVEQRGENLPHAAKGAAKTPAAAGLDIDEPFASAAMPASRPATRAVDALDDPFADASMVRKAEQAPEKARTTMSIEVNFDEPTGEDDEIKLKDFFAKKAPPAPPRPATPVPPAPRSPVRAPAAKAPPTSGPAARQAALNAPPKTARSAPSAPAAAVSEERLQSVYRTYLTARKRCNEPIEGLSYEKLAGALRKQAEGKGAVDFKVVIRGGKAVIKLVKPE